MTTATINSNIFDVLVIGSGPAAVAALDGLAGIAKVAVVTGSVSQDTKIDRLHAKIHAVAVERKELLGLAEPLEFIDERLKPLAATATVGGLANYWGQQFVRFGARDDPWPADVFSNHDAYLAGCKTVERLFSIAGGIRFGSELLFGPYSARTPRLLTGTRERPTLGLLAMRSAFEVVTTRLEAKIFPSRALSFQAVNSSYIVLLDNGQKVSARRILLASGVLGSALMMLRSFRDIAGFRFVDHAPWMTYTIGLRRLMRHRPPSTHFNMASIERWDGDDCTSFISVYNMAHAELNLLLASVTGSALRMFRGWRAPLGVSFVNPVQIWTPDTFDLVEFDAQGGNLKVCGCPATDSKNDEILASNLKMLRANGAHVLKTSRSQPGFGFHYHNLQIKTAGHKYQSVISFLRERNWVGCRMRRRKCPHSHWLPSPHLDCDGEGPRSR